MGGSYWGGETRTGEQQKQLCGGEAEGRDPCRRRDRVCRLWPPRTVMRPMYIEGAAWHAPYWSNARSTKTSHSLVTKLTNRTGTNVLSTVARLCVGTSRVHPCMGATVDVVVVVAVDAAAELAQPPLPHELVPGHAPAPAPAPGPERELAPGHALALAKTTLATWRT